MARTALDPPRYLVSFHPKQIGHRFTDILILGSGLAGLRAALAVDPRLHVQIVTKEKASHSNSRYAQGGIAAVWDPVDCFAFHMQDTLIAGKGLCDEDVVDQVVREAPDRIRDLMDFGAVFDSQNGEYLLTREGGHSFSRILHALGDATGKEVIRAVLERVRQLANVDMYENTFTIDLLTEGDRCVGALTWSPTAGIQAIWAKQTILATGGCGQLFRETTNPPVATGDGLAMAYRAGARVQDMEFVQFHPTVLYVAGSSRSLISEAVRGEGAFLRDCNGDRFMPDYDEREELAPRDVVAQAITLQMAKTQHPCVYLDQSHLDAETVRKRFPGITAACAKYGLDFATDKIPVRPGAHYMVGGVSSDRTGRTTLDGLWAAGEVAGSGLHGANRLASNSLLEALVFGHLCGEGASEKAASQPDLYQPMSCQNRIETSDHADASEELDLADIRNALSSRMFRNVSIDRDEAGLLEADRNVEFWCRYGLRHEFSGPPGWELQNMLTVAGLVIASALLRKESRGTHYRSDFPKTDDKDWRVHLGLTRGVEPAERLPVHLLSPVAGADLGSEI